MCRGRISAQIRHFLSATQLKRPSWLCRGQSDAAPSVQIRRTIHPEPPHHPSGTARHPSAHPPFVVPGSPLSCKPGPVPHGRSASAYGAKLFFGLLYCRDTAISSIRSVSRQDFCPNPPFLVRDTTETPFMAVSRPIRRRNPSNNNPSRHARPRPGISTTPQINNHQTIINIAHENHPYNRRRVCGRKEAAV